MMPGRTSTRLALVLAAVVLAGTGGAAIWVPMTLQELVAQSPLIVVGEIVAVSEQPTGAQDVAIIRVDELLLAKPPARGLPEARLLIPSRNRGLASSDAVYYKVGQRGIWFLRRDPASKDDLYLADHPHRLKAIDELANVRTYLKSATP